MAITAGLTIPVLALFLSFPHAEGGSNTTNTTVAPTTAFVRALHKGEARLEWTNTLLLSPPLFSLFLFLLLYSSLDILMIDQGSDTLYGSFHLTSSFINIPPASHPLFFVPFSHPRDDYYYRLRPLYCHLHHHSLPIGCMLRCSYCLRHSKNTCPPSWAVCVSGCDGASPLANKRQ